jgi:hypothetical protein
MPNCSAALLLWDLKGFAGSTRAWAALRARPVESRFEALHSAGLTALVGREEECELLLRRWSRAKVGDGQVVLISGEAGIGKSRLTAALLEYLGNDAHTRLQYFCSPQHTDSTLYPIIGQMERAAGLTHDDTREAKLDKLAGVLAQTSTSIQDATLFAEMLLLPNDGRYPALELPPSRHDVYLAPLRDTEWFVDAKKPFGGPEQVLRYMARYTHRVAIANSRYRHGSAVARSMVNGAQVLWSMMLDAVDSLDDGGRHAGPDNLIIALTALGAIAANYLTPLEVSRAICGAVYHRE